MDVIERLRVKFSARKDLNDPFEFCATPDEAVIRIELAKIHAETFASEKRNVRKQNPDIRRSEFRKAMSEARRQSRRELPLAPQKYTEELLRQTDAAIRIFSCTELPESVPMWAHYTANHTGFQIGFAPTEIFEHWPAADSKTMMLRRVDYQPTVPVLTPGETSAFGFAAAKMSDWAYEKEWRFLSTVDQATERSPGLELFRFRAASVKEITFALNASDDTIGTVISTAQESGLACNFFHMNAERNSYGLLRTRIEHR